MTKRTMQREINNRVLCESGSSGSWHIIKHISKASDWFKVRKSRFEVVVFGRVSTWPTIQTSRMERNGAE